jgi:hypothetical protein
MAKTVRSSAAPLRLLFVVIPARDEEDRHRWLGAAIAGLQPDGRVTAQGDRARLQLEGRTHHVAEPPLGHGQVEAKEMGSRYFFICMYI